MLVRSKRAGGGCRYGPFTRSSEWPLIASFDAVRELAGNVEANLTGGVDLQFRANVFPVERFANTDD